MATMIDKKPAYKGEGVVWEKIREYLPEEMIVYNQREVNGREYDFCVMCEDKGILVIEVKGWTADSVTVNGIDNIVIEGYDEPQASPKKQARAYRFAILNRIVKKYSQSPLVLDMVCYPFISYDEYKNCHLDVVSEKEYTILKEDLESEEVLTNKINNVFQINSGIPHSDFSCDLLVRIRHSLEPEFKKMVSHDKTVPYSKLRAFSQVPTVEEIEEIMTQYFAGVKSIVFVNDKEIYNVFLSILADKLKQHGIKSMGKNLALGTSNEDLKSSDSCFKTFNFELYLVPDLKTFCREDLCVYEGNVTFADRAVLEKLALRTEFNFQQYEVEHATIEQDVLVEAGAGTGKTYSMVSRIAYLCNRERDSVNNLAEEIAMVTFTNDAAANMRRRLKQMFINYYVLTGNEKHLRFVEDIDRSYISTIHKFAIGILRGESLYTGLGTNFRIAENEYKRERAYDAFLGSYLEEKERENSNFINELPVPVYELKKKLMSVASQLFNKSVDFSSIKKSEMGTTVENNIPYFNDLITEVVFPAEAAYLEGLKAGNDLDLKESLIELGRILSSGCGKLEELRFRYLFIDEFQDTDDVQIEIFQKLQKCINASCRLFVVGDLKQSIYRFRGAKLNAFQRLQNGKEMEWSHHRLNRNYRTDGRLLDLFDDVFEEMGREKILPYSKVDDKLISDVVSDVSDDELFVKLSCHGKDEDALMGLLCDTIVSEIARVKKSMTRKSLSREERTIAILVRSNRQVDRVVSAATQRDLLVEVNSGGDLFQLPSTLDLYKLIQAIIHSTSPIHLVNFIESNYVDLKLDYQWLRGISSGEKAQEVFDILDAYFIQRMGINWGAFLKEVYTQPVLYVLKRVIDALRPWDVYTNFIEKKRMYISNLEYLIEKIIKFSRVDTLTLDQVAEYLRINILSGQKQLSRVEEVDDNDVHVICSTVHKSKGLEYGTVILPYTFEDISDMKKVKLEANYNDGTMAYTVQFENGICEKNSNYDEDREVHEQVAEEARILYVALTRTISKCIWINNIDSTPRISWGTLLEG